MDIDVQDEYRRIGAFYATVEDVPAWPEGDLFRVRAGISAWSPAHHLYHILRANGMMCKAIALLCAGLPTGSPEGTLNPIGRRVLSEGRIPRGRAQAPPNVVPPDEVSRDDLTASLARSRTKYDETAALLPAIPRAVGRIPHPYFGALSAAEWLRLIRIHSEHHLAILREIVAPEETA